MSTSPNAPESQEHYQYEAASAPRWILIVFVVVFVMIGWLLYANYQSKQSMQAEMDKSNQRSDLLAKQLEQANGRIAELKGLLDVTSEKIQLTQAEIDRAKSLAQNIRKEQQATGAELSAKIGQVSKATAESAAKLGEVSGGLAGAKTDIEATRKDLEATKSKLERTTGDMGVMSGLIAKNHDELEDLKRRGERNIFEFDLRKSKTPSRVGPIQLTLTKVDVKKLKFNMDVIADDKRIAKENKTVNEPVQFYVRGARPPYEIVVYEVSKDRAVGYLSTPKEAGTPKQ
jgi:chromosome segregation ATPase